MQPTLRSFPYFILFSTALGWARAQSVNVNVGPLGDTHKHRWYVWLIVSVSGAAFLVSLFYTIRGIVIYRRKVRAMRAQRKAAALGVSLDSLPSSAERDIERGLFSFWKTDSLDLPPSVPLGRHGSALSKATQEGAMVSEDNAQKLRAMQRGTAAQREAEHLYRTGQHPSSVQLLHHLRRIDSF